MYYSNFTISYFMHNLLIFSKYSGNSELDFVIEKNGEIAHIEVKAGNAATKSLNRFIEEFKPSVAYKLISGNIGMNETKLTLPHYLAMFIQKLSIIYLIVSKKSRLSFL